MSKAYPSTIFESKADARSTAKVTEMHEHLTKSDTLRAEHATIEGYLEVEGREPGPMGPPTAPCSASAG